MNPIFAQLIIFGVQELIKYEPQMQAAIIAVLTKKDSTAQDWIDLAKQYPRKEYEDIVTESGLKPTE